ncbi:MAG: hypothetical protein NTW86_31130, partial [Candidatus Sumerlaeota bacterium]|nr:hypothetical protein [Candidatus Sumerlaeota bacterium]
MAGPASPLLPPQPPAPRSLPQVSSDQTTVGELGASSAHPAGARPTAPRPAAPRSPKPSSGASPLISKTFVDADLRVALDDISRDAGVTIVSGPDVIGYVSCEFQHAPLEKALELVLTGTGFLFEKKPDYYLVYSPDPKSPGFPHVSETRWMRLKYAIAPAVVALLSEDLRQYVRADEKTNTICITAPAPLLDRILSDISKLDQAPRQLILDARAVVLENTDLDHLGIQWRWPTVAAGAFSNSDHHGSGPLAHSGASWPWAVEVGYAPDGTLTNSLLLTLNLMAENDQLTIISSPRVLAQDGKPSEMNVVTEEYFQILTLTGAAVYSSELQKVDSGTKLKITPWIGLNDEITMDLSVEVSDVVAREASGLPVVNRRTATSTVRVNDNGTAVVAGLLNNSSRNAHQRVPGFARIPL